MLMSERIRINDAAAASLIAEGGTASLTMAGLARRSGVAKATVYNHFRDRTEVSRALAESLVEALSAECLRYPPEERLAVAARLIAESTTLAGLRRHDPAALVALVDVLLALTALLWTLATLRTFAPLALGRPLVMPPGVPADRLAAMRKALADTFADPAFAAESKRLVLGADMPRNGDAIEAVIKRVYATPRRVLDRWQTLNTVPR
jgi:AcrR family transcriptional regulator